MPKSYLEMIAEIKNFMPWRGPELAPGVSGYLHFPERAIFITYTNNGEWRNERVVCACGAQLDVHLFSAPSDQPSPMIWVSLEAFKKHLAEQQEAAFSFHNLSDFDKRLLAQCKVAI